MPGILCRRNERSALYTSHYDAKTKTKWNVRANIKDTTADCRIEISRFRHRAVGNVNPDKSAFMSEVADANPAHLQCPTGKHCVFHR